MSSKNKGNEELEPTGDNVEQIREILFGGHIRAFDERFELVETRLARENSTLKKAMEKRLEELERLLADYREQASDQLGEESSNRDLALNKIELAMASARMDAENSMAQMQDHFDAEVKTLRSELAAAQKASEKALDNLQKEQTRRADKLDEDKVDRLKLAKFLNDMAEQIQPAKPRSGK